MGHLPDGVERFFYNGKQRQGHDDENADAEPPDFLGVREKNTEVVENSLRRERQEKGDGLFHYGLPHIHYFCQHKRNADKQRDEREQERECNSTGAGDTVVHEIFGENNPDKNNEPENRTGYSAVVFPQHFERVLGTAEKGFPEG
jgi:hypothetical protein